MYLVFSAEYLAKKAQGLAHQSLCVFPALVSGCFSDVPGSRYRPKDLEKVFPPHAKVFRTFLM